MSREEIIEWHKKHGLKVIPLSKEFVQELTEAHKSGATSDELTKIVENERRRSEYLDKE